MKATIKINMDNAAFKDNTGGEMARILRELADGMDGQEIYPGALNMPLDINGNKVGTAKITK